LWMFFSEPVGILLFSSVGQRWMIFLPYKYFRAGLEKKNWWGLVSFFNFRNFYEFVQINTAEIQKFLSKSLGSLRM
jgi:hypothetical protein